MLLRILKNSSYSVTVVLTCVGCGVLLEHVDTGMSLPSLKLNYVWLNARLYIYIYIYICMRVYVCVSGCVCLRAAGNKGVIAHYILILALFP